jgi:hypothetical protein
MLQYTVVLRAPGARVTEETSLPAAILINCAFITVREAAGCCWGLCLQLALHVDSS